MGLKLIWSRYLRIGTVNVFCLMEAIMLIIYKWFFRSQRYDTTGFTGLTLTARYHAHYKNFRYQLSLCEGLTKNRIEE